MKKLFLLALLAGAYLLFRKLQRDRADWEGLTRSEAVEKMTNKITEKASGRMEPNQIEAIASAVVEALIRKGIVVPDPATT